MNARSRTLVALSLAPLWSCGDLATEASVPLEAALLASGAKIPLAEIARTADRRAGESVVWADRAHDGRLPEIAISGPVAGREGEEVVFRAAESGEPVGGLTYRWDFGDGHTATGATPAHAFADDGVYAVTLTVTSDRGARGTASTTATIANAPPVVDAGAGGTVVLGTSYALRAHLRDPGVQDALWSYQIDWGDGRRPSTGVTSTQGDLPPARHRYAAPGTYPVTVVVRNKDGATHQDRTFVAVVPNKAPTAVANGPYAGDEKETIQFSSEGSTDPEGSARSYLWSFGDGTFSSAEHPAKRYSDDGTYTVTLTVRDPSGSTSTVSTTAVIRNVAPTLSLGAPMGIVEGAGFSVGLIGNDAGPVDRLTLEYAIDCGRGYGSWSRSTRSRACPVAADDARLTVRGKVRDKDGAVTEVARTLTVANAPPRVQLAAVTPTTLPPGGTLGVEGLFHDPGVQDMPWEYTLSWGDGTSTTGSTWEQARPISASRSYGAPGTYNVTLAVKDTDGATRSRTLVVVVR